MTYANELKLSMYCDVWKPQARTAHIELIQGSAGASVFLVAARRGLDKTAVATPQAVRAVIRYHSTRV